MQTQNKNLYPDSYTRWNESKTTDNAAELLKSISPVIKGAIKSYAGGNAKNTTRANIMAMKAIRSYDPNRGLKLNTHVMSQLKALNRHSRQNKSVIHVPENIYLNRRAITEAKSEYMEQRGIEPTETALADKTGLTVRQIRQTDKYSTSHPSSVTTSEKGDSMVDKKRDYYDIWTDYVYNDMDDIDKKIFEGVSGYNNKPIKQKQSLAKELGMTSAAVSYRIGNIASKLEEMPQDEIG